MYDKDLYDQIFCTAQREGIAVQAKTAVAGGNDAGAIHLSRTGVRVAAVSLPCRYIHSPSCVISKKDLEQTAKLLNSLISELAVTEDTV